MEKRSSKDNLSKRLLKAGELPTYVELKRDETVSYQLKDGSSKKIRLMYVSSTQVSLRVEDTLIQISFEKGNFQTRKRLPRIGILEGLEIGVEVTKYCRGLTIYSDSHLNLSTDVRLRLCDSKYPITSKQNYIFPVQDIQWDRRDNWLDEVGFGYHIGVDIVCPEGKPVLTVTAGEVIAVKEYRPGIDKEDYRGKRVMVLGNDGLLYHYSHFSIIESHIIPGTILSSGEKTGNSGRTGFETKKGIVSHLHFEIWKVSYPRKFSYRYEDGLPILPAEVDGFVVDPLPYLWGWYERKKNEQHS